MARPIFKDGLGYEGKVKLTLKSNNRVLETKVYKNAGTSQLFSFLGYCLIGSYSEVAKRLLPSKVRLLLNNSKNGEDPTKIDARSYSIGLAQTPTIVNKGDEVLVTYSFEIPRSAIEGEFNQVALYGAGVSEAEPEAFSAYYFLTGNDGNVSAQNPSEWSSTTVLLIDWELSLSNKSVEIRDTYEEEVE